jgi:putative oxidoreductase
MSDMSEHSANSNSSFEDKAFLLARVLMSLLFMFPAYRKASSIDFTTAYFDKLGLPFPSITVFVVIAFEFIAGLCFLMGWRLKLVAYLMAAFSVAAAFIAHRFWDVDPAMAGNQLTHMLKNGAIAGGFVMAALYFDRREHDSSDAHHQ